MAQKFYTRLTKIGQAKYANAVGVGEQINMTQLAVGDANGQPLTPDQVQQQEVMINQVRVGPINHAYKDADNPNWLVLEQILPPAVGGWTIREVGIYDDQGDLVAYGNYPETYKPILDEGSSRTSTVRFVLMVSDTSAVTLKVDPSVVLATRQYVDDRDAEHAKSRNHPYATTTAQGMAELATGTEAKARADKKTVLTPETGGLMLAEHEQAEVAHAAGQISSEVIPQAGDALNVQAVLSALGAFAGDVGQNIAIWSTAGVRNWDVPDVLKNGLRDAHVTVIGAGASGGVNDVSGPGGGGAGGITSGMVSLEGLSTIPVTVGKGGDSRASNGNGYSGGASSFGSIASATGGQGGLTGAGGSPGLGSGLLFKGGLGYGHYGSQTVANSPAGGNGGGPGGGRGQNGGASDGALPGAGGGGSSNQSGAGADGIVIVRW